MFYVEITNIQWYFNCLCFTCNVSFEALLIQCRNVLGDSVVGMNPDRTYPSWYKNVIPLWILFGMAWLALVIRFCISILESSSDFCQCNKKNAVMAEDLMDGNKNNMPGLQNVEICTDKDKNERTSWISFLHSSYRSPLGKKNILSVLQVLVPPEINHLEMCKWSCPDLWMGWQFAYWVWNV